MILEIFQLCYGSVEYSTPGTSTQVQIENLICLPFYFDQRDTLLDFRGWNFPVIFCPMVQIMAKFDQNPTSWILRMADFRSFFHGVSMRILRYIGKLFSEFQVADYLRTVKYRNFNITPDYTTRRNRINQVNLKIRIYVRPFEL